MTLEANSRLGYLFQKSGISVPVVAVDDVDIDEFSCGVKYS
jgi:hypothetical protein